MRVMLRALGAVVGTFHGLVGLLGLVLYRTGPEHWSMLVTSLSLVSTPAALVAGVWGGQRLAAAWLGGAALTSFLVIRGGYAEWWYAVLFYGPQLVAAVLLLRGPCDRESRPDGSDRPGGCDGASVTRRAMPSRDAR